MTKMGCTSMSGSPTDKKAVLTNLDGRVQIGRRIRLRLAVVAGDLVGPQEALDRLAKLQPSEPTLTEDQGTLTSIYNGHLADAMRTPTKKALVDHQKWFGKLAPTLGKPDTDPDRAGLVGGGGKLDCAGGLDCPWVILVGGLGGMAAFVTMLVLMATGGV